MIAEKPDYPEIASCAPQRLYQNGGLYDSAYDLRRIETLTEAVAEKFEFIEEMFPGSPIRRSELCELLGPTPANYENIRAEFHAINQKYSVAAPSVMVRIHGAIIWQNMIFLELGDHHIPVYECYRQNDRQEKGENLAAGINYNAIVDLDQSETENLLFIGSAGSFNYGHWLTDDFPRYIGAEYLIRNFGKVKVVISQFGEAINSIRQRALELVSNGSPDAVTTYINPQIPYRVRSLYYVTPVSYHPFVKNPSAIAYVKDIKIPSDQSIDAPGRLYVNRYAPWPRLVVNSREIMPVLEEWGYRDFPPDRHTLDRQIAAFRGAEQIIGIMGAGMTNVIFASPGTRITFMAPDGWNEVYFWDLMTLCHHDYRVLFRTGHEDGHHLYQRSFEIDPEYIIERIIADLGLIQSLPIIVKSKINLKIFLKMYIQKMRKLIRLGRNS